MNWVRLSPRAVMREDGEWLIAEDAHTHRFHVKHREARDWRPPFATLEEAKAFCDANQGKLFYDRG